MFKERVNSVASIRAEKVREKESGREREREREGGGVLQSHLLILPTLFTLHGLTTGVCMCVYMYIITYF